MAVPSPSFFFALLVILYLVSLAFFAVVRIATGVSVQRLGYFSLRRISYTLQDGIRIDIRTLRLHLHRPTFAKPTWLSLRFTELKITVDVSALSKGGLSQNDSARSHNPESQTHGMTVKPASSEHPLFRNSIPQTSWGKIWRMITVVKERIKVIHQKIDWLRMVDVEFINSTCLVKGVASFQVASVSLAVDTRRKTVDRGRLFRHKKTSAGEQQPAEWVFVLKGVLFTAEGMESLEILDICSLNIHGFIYRNIPGLRDASISVKLGRIHVPYDDVLHCQRLIESKLDMANSQNSLRGPRRSRGSTAGLVAGTTARDGLADTVSDFREVVSSLLRGIQEVQMAISFIGLSKQVRGIKPSGKSVFLNVAMNEFGVDLFRLDPKGPAHRMYFVSRDVAHQALLAAISIGFSIDDGDGRPQRILYIPMVTTTIRTTLPTKAVVQDLNNDHWDRNANVLFANLVVTSPSLDLDLKHMSLVIAILRSHIHQQGRAETDSRSGFRAVSRLLPKASITISVQESVARIVLPPSEPTADGLDDYDLLISTISTISLELESSHTPAEDVHYSLSVSLRITSHKFYYQTASGIRHSLLRMNAFEARLNLVTTHHLSVMIEGNMETFTVHMIRPEISEGLHQIIQQLGWNAGLEDNSIQPEQQRQSFLRNCPSWLIRVHFRGSRFELEVAGKDAGVSQDLRGVAIQLQSWSAEYQVHQPEFQSQRQHIHSKDHSKNMGFVHREKAKSSPDSADCKDINAESDGRHLILHGQGFETFIVEGVDVWDPDPFLSMPKIELSMSTSSDVNGPAFHVACFIQALFVRYSLYRYYVLGVGYSVLRKALDLERYMSSETQKSSSSNSLDRSLPCAERTMVDLKIPIFQVKASMPSEPALMLQIYGFEGGLQRWSSPFLRSRLIRLYGEAPGIRAAWARVVSIKNFRVDLRESRKRVGKSFAEDRSFDIAAEFIRLAIPHQVVFHKIVDNVINVLKASEQMNYRFETGTDTYILGKEPQHARKLPRISLRSKVFMFEIEDGLFEWKLGLIYRVGLSEQKQRLARADAYEMKIKKMQGKTQRRDSSRHESERNETEQGRSKQLDQASSGPGKAISHASSRSPTLTPPLRQNCRIRYDGDAISGLTGTARISAEEAKERLEEHNAVSWKKRIFAALHYQSASNKDTRRMFWGKDESPKVDEDTETILSIPDHPGLMTALISDLHIIIDKPSFPIQKTSNFLNRIGKGMPFDMQYSLLIPMSLLINMGETRMTLRNYPLPLLHIPTTRSNQSSRLASWSVKADFVIAEEFRDASSMKHVKVEVVPPGKMFHSRGTETRFCIDVRRTVSPVKTYSDIDISVNTGYPTTIAWGTSYQPAIQDMMQIIETFSKPRTDLSERVGFWDKIRLVFHSRLRVAWKGGGDVHLRLKGSRDPYAVTGHGAGFMMCFRSGVNWCIHQQDDPRSLMSVNCGEYVLAIPDYRGQARETRCEAVSEKNVSIVSPSHQHSAIFQKVIMKVTGKVRWVAGLVFERDNTNGSRSFAFVPHYKVQLRAPSHVKPNNVEQYDAFHGFRSQYIHLSLAVMAPEDREWSATNSNESTTYNSMHLSPKFFTHFFDWWCLFSGVMSLPIRQGKLFASGDKSSKKFGRHLATIKYSLLLAPFYVSHIYKHKDREDYTKDVVGATGLKLRLESFVLDLHQRREEVASQGKGRLKLTRSSGMRINKAQLDFLSADIRAVSALIKGTAAEDLQRATDEELASYDDKSFMPSDVKHFNIPDNATVWIDMDDFVELDWILPAETHPETRIMPLAFAPRFTYIRQTDHVKDDFQDSERSSPFGEESTHICMMTTDNDPQRVQQHLIERRISVLREKLDSHERLITELEARFRGQQSRDLKLEEQRRILQEQREMIGQKISFMQSILKRILQHLQSTWNCRGSLSTGSSTPDVGPTVQTSEFDDLPNALQPLSLANDFNNCFIIHNIHLKWNNSLRNIILRYVHQVSQRRGFVYYMSRRAVRFILDIVEEQQRHKNKAYTYAPGQTTTAESSSSASFKDQTEDVGLEERIQELLNDGKNLVAADDPKPYASSRQGSGVIKEDLSEEYTAHNSYHVRLIAPQIQLQSDKNSRSVLLVTGREMQLKIVQIMDRSRLADDVSGLVQRRFSVDMDGIQFFVTNRKTINKFLHLHSAERYGSPKNSAWPPWAPVEVNFDFRLNPIGWSRVVQKTSASLRYDKYNTLRLKYNDEVNKSDPQRSSVAEDIESRIDHLWVEFPHIRAICDSTQYYAMYVIVLDLLFYSEPLEKTRTERLEKIMLAADFSDLSGAPGMVTSLQDRVRQLEEIKSHFQLHAKHLDRHGWQDRLAIERDLTSCEDELFFIMKAITTSQRKYDDRTPDSQSNGLLRWNLSASEIVWHLMRENDEPLVEIRLQHASYHRTDNSDGSNHNDMEIERIHGLNLLPDASYPEMIAPYFESSISETEKQQSMKMFRVHWVMLEAIAGIPILDQFEVNLFPLRVQLEREVGKKLFEYIFPGNGTPNDVSPFLLEQTLPLQASNDSDNEDDRDEDDTRFLDIPHKADFDKPRTSTRAGSLELRLRPTITLPSPPVPTNSGSIKAKQSYSSLITAGSSQDRFTQSAAVSTVSLGPHSSISLPNSRKRSNSNLLAWDRPPHEASSANVSIATSSSEPSRKLNPQRTNSGLNKEKLHPPDDITEMMSRASNYMTLAYAKVPSVVLCLSYKGRAERNIEDVHNFVFRMPTLEYRNKTWSNLDLALRLKKDVVKALISHTGAIIGNKFQHHRPTKHQQSRPREAATSLSLLSNTDNLNSFVRSSTTASDDAPGRERQMVPSSSAFIAGWGSQTIRTSSSTTSLDSMISPGNTTTFDSPGRNYRRV